MIARNVPHQYVTLASKMNMRPQQSCDQCQGGLPEDYHRTQIAAPPLWKEQAHILGPPHPQCVGSIVRNYHPKRNPDSNYRQNLGRPAKRLPKRHPPIVSSNVI